MIAFVKFSAASSASGTCALPSSENRATTTD